MNLIKTPQHWFPRAVDILLTLCAWLGFAYLLINGIAQLSTATSWHHDTSFSSLFLGSLDSLLLYLLLSLAIGSILLVWAKYRQVQVAHYQRRKGVPNITREDLAKSFRIRPQVLELLHQRQILILHNDEHGDLTEVEVPTDGLRLAAQEPLLRSGEGLSQPSGKDEPKIGLG